MSKTDTTEQQDNLGEAGAQLSTAPVEERASVIGGPTLGVVGWVRWFWRQLTSMRVALILLFMLSLGAVPGSLIPQTSADELKVQAFKDAHKTLTPLYEKLQFFDVYSSVWFSAIYILLFVSLIGCIVPRSWQFVGQLRSRPPGAPKRLDRLPAYTTWRTEAEPEQVREAALTLLKGRRFRALTAGDAVAAEKGYLREAGNLAFHVALIVMLVAFAWGQLFKSEGGKLIVEGDGFSNTLTQYDDFKSGSQFGIDELEPFSFKLDSFNGTYEKNGPQRGTPRTFEAAVSYSQGGTDKKAVIRVNEPLEVGDSKVYLIAHGYAPVVTVKDGRGKTVFHGAVPLLPIDNNITSTGAIKVMDGYRDKNGKKEQLGFQAFFVPTFAGAGAGTMFSQFPALDFPVMALTGFHGDLRVNSGLPQNVYQLDKSKMKQFMDASGNKLAQRMLPGETMTLPDGAGSITFEKDVKEWASFQISQQPGNGLALAGAIAAIAGLTGSLFIQRRRIWVRAVRGEDGVTVVEMAGLGRSESAKLPEELGDLAVALTADAPPAPDAAPVPPAEDPAPSGEADK
ncbi:MULTISPECIES: cytochrome c biogenesis protein ResB [Streptomyces]|uniref:Ccs1 or ResB-related putative cytochrome C-type biogenesis protein n=1 Tax=Streptomyces venezuelae (strain ATCC 10712 / CBS 650.69 / DSM 40230 / JCM 4526 / NBRC 13096 / PD 04745) TaxID=953739 RepID=F2R8W7_STRVP|nr:cytochrome c biogenesis protein ResB [Streptomyces venezuelae]APE22273.1 cytochrome C biogenesis protein [Streptomyces venezuelae]QER99657.1 cytochrome c biogenesis protein ResB [Streptomyces venezuelae ATCC 10712]CCA56427.1 Ccs1 or ResB-related putative cytochrome C-type biogenesis protein [Streptomyces venezuelae ATCC 10712]